jgi:hypothetical protein
MDELALVITSTIEGWRPPGGIRQFRQFARQTDRDYSTSATLRRLFFAFS